MERIKIKNFVYDLVDEQPQVGDYYKVILYFTGDLADSREEIPSIEKCDTIDDVWVNKAFKETTRHIGNCKKIIATNNPALIENGVYPTGDYWFNTIKTLEERKELYDKYGSRLGKIGYSERFDYMRDRELGLVCPIQDAEDAAIDEAANQFAKSHGFMAYFDEDKYAAFVTGAKWFRDNFKK